MELYNLEWMRSCLVNEPINESWDTCASSWADDDRAVQTSCEAHPQLQRVMLLTMSSHREGDLNM